MCVCVSVCVQKACLAKWLSSFEIKLASWVQIEDEAFGISVRAKARIHLFFSNYG